MQESHEKDIVLATILIQTFQIHTEYLPEKLILGWGCIS